MADWEKVIKQLENDAIATDTGYIEVPLWLFSEILALLKEQEAVEPFHKCIGKHFSFIEDRNYDYCPYCGKPILWEGR